MFLFKTFRITAILVALVFVSFVNQSHTFEIVDLYPSQGGYQDYSYGGICYHTAYVNTDAPYFMIDWYVDSEWKSTTQGHSDNTDAYFSPSDIPGNTEGITYNIEAVAYSFDGVETRESYDVTVCTVEAEGGPDDTPETPTKHTNTSMTVEISCVSYDPSATVTWDDWNGKVVDWRGVVNSDGNFTLTNLSDDDTYYYTWEARLEILKHAWDEKDNNGKDKITLEPDGEDFLYSKSLSLPVDRTGAPREEWHTALATYTLNVDTGKANEVDSCQVNVEYEFYHDPDEQRV